MSKKLYKDSTDAMRVALEGYYDGVYELNYVIEKFGEILENKYNNDTQKIYIRDFWAEDNDADLDTALDETIQFCLDHDIKDYTIVLDDNQECVAVVYLLKMYMLNKGDKK